MPTRTAAALLAVFCAAATANAQVTDDPAALQADARQMLDLVATNYAYSERIGESWAQHNGDVEASLGDIVTRLDLLSFAEGVLHRLCDHHAITGPSSQASAALVPSFADLWIETDPAGGFVITQVRAHSPAAAADIRPGDRLDAIGGVALGDAIETFWTGSLPRGADCPAYAARVLAAGPRTGSRTLTLLRGDRRFEVELPSLYAQDMSGGEEPLFVEEIAPGIRHIVFHDSLGDSDTIGAIDAAIGAAPAGTRFVIDLRNTPSGGNTSVARALLGYFTSQVQPYQHHSLPAEMRETGVARSWLEEVSPRGPEPASPRRAVVLAGRWTGSMGEGLAVGFDALGQTVAGSPMAGLLGAIYDLELDNTGWIFKLPVERLSHVDGRPREDFQPPVAVDPGYAGAGTGDAALAEAVRRLSDPG